VGSTADLGSVENAVQPLVGSGRLLDHITIGSMTSRTDTGASAPVVTAASASVVNVASPPDQQSEVEQALHGIPRLSNVNVQLATDGVHLSGAVDSMQDDQMAAEVARQYAPGRPVLNNLTVANRTQPAQQ
jgi:osmotically-inducible protein OsmY